MSFTPTISKEQVLFQSIEVFTADNILMLLTTLRKHKLTMIFYSILFTYLMAHFQLNSAQQKKSFDGLTEALRPLINNSVQEKAVLDLIQRILPSHQSKYFEVEIRDPEKDISVRDGQVGEIMVRPKQPFGFMSGYMGMPEKTVETWRNFWFHTGDAGIREPSGYFTFVDRIKDCIRRRGENISSYEVEQAFLEIGYITEAAAYAIPAKGGEGMEDEVMVALMLNENHIIDFSDLLKKAKINLAKFAIPKYIRIMNEFPKTQTGKIQKNKLRDEGVTLDTWQNDNM